MKTKVGLIGLGFFVLIAIFGPLLAPYDPSASSADVLMAPSVSHLFGTTQQGQDVFSQFLVGAGPTLLVGFLGAAIATVLGVIVGITSGYFRGPLGESLALTSNIFLVLPTLPLLIVVVGYFPEGGPLFLGLVIGLTSWAFGARVIRAQTLTLRARDYVDAARAVGDSSLKIFVYDLLPGLLPVIASSFLFGVAYSILTMTGLEFLGLTNLSSWTWGVMLFWTQNNAAYQQGAWWWYIPPGLAIAMVGFFLSLLQFGSGDRTRTTKKRKQRAAKTPLMVPGEAATVMEGDIA